MARRRHNPGSGASGYVLLAGVGIAAYFAYEWLKTNCASSAPQFPSLCALLPPATAVAATSASAAAPASGLTTAQLAQVAAYCSNNKGTWDPNAETCSTVQNGVTLSAPASLLYQSMQAQGAEPGTPAGSTTLPTPPTMPAPPPAVTGGSNLYGPPTSTAWQLAIATMKAAAGTNSLNYNQWFWYFQNTPAPVGAPSGFGVPGSVTPQVAALTAQIGGDPTGASNITAEQFATAFATARAQSGISGFGFNREPGIPASWLTTYGFDGDAYL